MRNNSRGSTLAPQRMLNHRVPHAQWSRPNRLWPGPHAPKNSRHATMEGGDHARAQWALLHNCHSSLPPPT
eukprot:1040416-Alexandrium_andersonii.AAC.3